MPFVWDKQELILIPRRHQILSGRFNDFPEAWIQKTSDPRQGNTHHTATVCHVALVTQAVGGSRADRQNQGGEMCETMECVLNADRTTEDYIEAIDYSFSVRLHWSDRWDSLKAENSWKSPHSPRTVKKKELSPSLTCFLKARQMVKHMVIPYEIISVVIALLHPCIKNIFHSTSICHTTSMDSWVIVRPQWKPECLKRRMKTGRGEKWEKMFLAF